MNLGYLFLAFRVPSYRWLWASSFTGSAGFMPYMMAEGWLLLELTDSPLMVGLSPALGSVASMVVSPFGGVLVDRFDRRKVLIATQSIMALAALTLGILAVTNSIEIWHVFAASAAQRSTIGLQLGARNTLMYDVVGRKGAMNAMAGQFMSTHSASVLGPLAGGIIMASFGPGVLFLLIGIFIAAGNLFVLQVAHSPRMPPIGSMWSNLKEGVDFAIRNKSIRVILWTVLITDGLGFSTWSMFPVVTRDVLHAGPGVLGLISGLRGLGGVVGALVLSSFGDLRPKGWIFFLSAFSFGLILILFAASRSVPLSLATIFVAGAVSTAYDTLAHTMLQTVTPENMRGRMMGLYAFVVSGIGYGSLIQGSIAAAVGVTWAITSAGATVALNAASQLRAAGSLSRASYSELPAGKR